MGVHAGQLSKEKLPLQWSPVGDFCAHPRDGPLPGDSSAMTLQSPHTHNGSYHKAIRDAWAVFGGMEQITPRKVKHTSKGEATLKGKTYLKRRIIPRRAVNQQAGSVLRASKDSFKTAVPGGFAACWWCYQPHCPD